MKRKLTVLTSAIAAGLVLSISTNVAAADKKVLLKLPVYFGTHLEGLGSTPKWLAERVNKMTNTIKVKIYEPGKLIPPKEILEAVNKGQVNAGYALGFTYGQTMSNVVLPQAFRNMLPVILTQSIVLFQDVSLVYVISAPDFLGNANTLANTYGAETKATFYLIVAVVYFCISFALSRLVKRLHQKIAIIR